MLIGPGANIVCGQIAPQSLGVLQGVPTATLQQWYNSALNAYAQLMDGSKVVTATYAQGDGSRSVTYTVQSRVNLQDWIMQLQRALGIPYSSRRPLRPYYR
jgi:hypothetical protein